MRTLAVASVLVALTSCGGRVDAGETRWITGIVRPDPPLERGEESQG